MSTVAQSENIFEQKLAVWSKLDASAFARRLKAVGGAGASIADLTRTVSADERMSRTALVGIADDYWSTLENDTGEIRDTALSAG